MKQSLTAALVFLRASLPVIGIVFAGCHIFGSYETIFWVSVWMVADLYADKLGKFLSGINIKGN